MTLCGCIATVLFCLGGLLAIGGSLISFPTYVPPGLLAMACLLYYIDTKSASRRTRSALLYSRIAAMLLCLGGLLVILGPFLSLPAYVPLSLLLAALFVYFVGGRPTSGRGA